MSTTAVIGGQWGDEGKGKIVDFLSEGADYCVRFQGGSNAGHTITVNGQVFKLRLLPSGVLRGSTGVLGAGMVINLDVLQSEVSYLQERGIEPKFFIDHRAHLVTPEHISNDVLREKESGNRIGTTRNGIGLCYEDKARRTGLRAGDLLTDFDSKVDAFLKFYDNSPHVKLGLVKVLNEWKDTWSKYIRTDLTDVLYRAMHIEDKEVVIEGAQGTLLDVSHGTYPFVTSSHTIAPSIAAGVGASLPRDYNCIGVFKAYCTRVGKGGFPSEDFTEDGDALQRIGKEVGVVTKRVRRCGWLNLDDMIYANQLNGFTSIVLTKVDVLDGFPKVKVMYEGEMQTLDGWDGSAKAKSWVELPENLMKFIDYIQEKTGVSVTMISNGPGRKDTLMHPFLTIPKVEITPSMEL
jgi:adenylosuccinate synthase